jgi:hypothetical protein
MSWIPGVRPVALYCLHSRIEMLRCCAKFPEVWSNRVQTVCLSINCLILEKGWTGGMCACEWSVCIHDKLCSVVQSIKMGGWGLYKGRWNKNEWKRGILDRIIYLLRVSIVSIFRKGKGLISARGTMAWRVQHKVTYIVFCVYVNSVVK